MAPLLEHIEKIGDEFTEDVRKCFSQKLVSVTLYGQAARSARLQRGAAINFIVAVRDNTPSELAPCSAYMKRWSRHGIAAPLFITPEYIRGSLDTFPLEFMEMKSSYRIFYGDDVLKDLEFEDKNVRTECEREIKGKLLHLRAEYLSLRGDRNGIADLVARSLNTFRLVFGGALYLKRKVAPAETSDLIELAAEVYDLNGKLLREIQDLAFGRIKPSPEKTDFFFDKYVEELDKLSRAIDSFI